MMRESRGGPVAHSQRVTSSDAVSTTPSAVEVGLQGELIGQRAGQRFEAGCGRVEACPARVEAERLGRELRRVLDLRPPADGCHEPRARRQRADAGAEHEQRDAHADDELDQRHAAGGPSRPIPGPHGNASLSSTT